MTIGMTRGVTLDGLEGVVVDVEADVSPGLPSFTVTGLADATVGEARDRIRAAASNAEVPLPARRLTVNLSPAWRPKAGSAFDLPMIVALLAATGALPPGVRDVVHLGELSLDGQIKAVRGVLPSVAAAVAAGHRRVIVPAANLREASLVEGADVRGARSLRDVVAFHRGSRTLPEPTDVDDDAIAWAGPDLADVVGQREARFALEVAAAGRHHVFFVGPPGAGKTMLAERLPGLLPALPTEQALEVTAIESIMSLDAAPLGLRRRPPYRAMHHGATMAAMVGGGTGRPSPGAVTAAHRGVLFLDEGPEFQTHVLNALRQPLESGVVTVGRSKATVTFPARFQLVLAANPCPCGRAVGKALACECTPLQRRNYFGKLSGPLLDRIDLQLTVPAVSRLELFDGASEATEQVAARVAQARACAEERGGPAGWAVNSEVPSRALREGPWCLPATARVSLDRALERGALTLRGYDRVTRVAWTIADLAGHHSPTRDDVDQALSLRGAAGVPA
ncbi:YifB family Mg chelatase-like AAA ATPase [Arsenicicoccus sp. oral taxon 190]|uniref:YifB family Mg chelatase-like AAA ATPase n=1 Tax=Arsenicicoccus sp. oral taxon 190 TaxID=1658671 RepID=UPI000679F377|nr:YifB family Mg chelatase-like AAA ATPase [Arsenicicoccus sp. oral taxon 190]AKT52234.1 Mg chelatase-like protein [Arsenicicoccus sp. oral taxon 190]